MERYVIHSGLVARLTELTHRSSYETEDDVVGFNHAALGSLICAKWQLAPDLIKAVSEHHSPSGQSQQSRLAAIVHLADVISLLPEVGIGSTKFTAVADPEILKWLGFDLDQVDRVASQVRRTLDDSKDFVMGMV
jgi:HD-like signal output (HDOD) protein